MQFQFSDDNLQMQRTLRQFMDRHVLPQNAEYERLAASGVYLTTRAAYFNDVNTYYARTTTTS